MKRNAILLGILFLGIVCLSMIGSAASGCNVAIQSLSVHPAGGIAPAKIGFTSYVSGDVERVTHEIIDSETGKVIGTCDAFCTHCTTGGICTCAYVIQEAGTYDVKVTAKGTDGCTATLVKKEAFIVTPKSLPDVSTPVKLETPIQEVKNETIKPEVVKTPVIEKNPAPAVSKSPEPENTTVSAGGFDIHISVTPKQP